MVAAITSDIFEVFDRALQDSRGVRIKFGNKGDALQFRHRLHDARRQERLRNRQIYADQPSHELYGRSIYECLAVRVRDEDDGFYVYVEHISIQSDIEPLSEIENATKQGDDPAVQGALVSGPRRF